MREFAQRYFDLIVGEFATINLTRILDFEEFYAKQVIDSVHPFELHPWLVDKINSCGLVVDIGFGGGVPILPLAHFFPGVAFVGIEARQKKVEVVKSMAKTLDLANVQCFHHRIEEIEIDIECVLTLKAVGEIRKMCNLLSISAPVTVLFYKGPLLQQKENLEQIGAHWRLIKRYNYDIEGTEGRELIVLESKKVPRGTSKKNKKVVKLSEII